jgi:hypothetical protein
MDLSLAVARIDSHVDSMSSKLLVKSESEKSTLSSSPGPTFASSIHDAGKSLWSQNVPGESEKQLLMMVERRLQLSSLVQKCGGQHMFASAAAATVSEYIVWVSEELKKDDGNISKVL